VGEGERWPEIESDVDDGDSLELCTVDDGDSTKAVYHSRLPRGYYGGL
jgi:hypothetical protein